MTRREAPELAALRTELAEARALRWSGLAVPERTVAPPASRVAAWETSLSTWAPFKTWALSSRPLYPTRLSALIALRLAKEQECAKVLAGIDALIVAERQIPGESLG